MIIFLKKLLSCRSKNIEKPPLRENKATQFNSEFQLFEYFLFIFFLKGERNCLKNVEGRRGDVVKIDDDGV